MNRNMAIAGAAAVLVAIYVFLLAPLGEKRVTLREKLEVSYVTLTKYEKFIKGSRDAGSRLEAAEAGLAEFEKRILQKTDTSVGFARLQNTVQGIAEKAGLAVRSIKPMPALEHKYYAALPIYLDFMGNIGQLSAFLRALDRGNVFISLDRLSISATQKGGLRIRMQVSGLMPI